MPEFEEKEGVETETPTAIPAASMDVAIPAFTVTSLAAIYKMIFDATADMAGTGDAGKLSDGEANLIAGLSADWINRQMAVSGMDTGSAQMYAAVGIILVTKAKVYYVAIRKKRKPDTPRITAKEQREETQAEAVPQAGPVWDDSGAAGNVSYEAE